MTEAMKMHTGIVHIHWNCEQLHVKRLANNLLYTTLWWQYSNFNEWKCILASFSQYSFDLTFNLFHKHTHGTTSACVSISFITQSSCFSVNCNIHSVYVQLFFRFYLPINEYSISLPKFNLLFFLSSSNEKKYITKERNK